MEASNKYQKLNISQTDENESSYSDEIEEQEEINIYTKKNVIPFTVVKKQKNLVTTNENTEKQLNLHENDNIIFDNKDLISNDDKRLNNNINNNIKNPSLTETLIQNNEKKKKTRSFEFGTNTNSSIKYNFKNNNSIFNISCFQEKTNQSNEKNKNKDAIRYKEKEEKVI